MIKANDISKVTRAVVAAAYRKHPTSVNKWVDRGCPRNADGSTYNLADVIAWREDDLALNSPNMSDEAKEASTRRMLALAARCEFDLEIAKGRYELKSDVEAGLIARILSVKNGLGNLIDRLPPQLEGLNSTDMRVVLKREIKILLRAFATVGGYDEKIAEKLKKELDENGGRFESQMAGNRAQIMDAE